MSTPPSPDPAAVGLAAGITACLFDLDGVLTRTAEVHAAAWAEMFDEYLRRRAARTGEEFVPFDPRADYDTYVDGKQRADGTEAFLQSRGIELPRGSADDPPDADTVSGLGNRKNVLLLDRIDRDGVRPYESSVDYVRRARGVGLSVAVVSSSANAEAALSSAGYADLIDVRVDGVVAARRHLAGKPDPATFLAAAEELGVERRAAAVFEDALAGVAAGRAGGFGQTVGVDRVGQADQLRSHGADVVVADLSELLEHR